MRRGRPADPPARRRAGGPALDRQHPGDPAPPPCRLAATRRSNRLPPARRAMLSGLILLVFLICYCCHKNMSKQASRNAQYWHEENEVPLEIFTVDSQCYEVAGVLAPSSSCGSLDTASCPPFSTPTPPPAYEAVVREDAKRPAPPPARPHAAPQPEPEDAGLPSYEAALRIEAQGYV
ncbi:uncharacterized protein LOC134531430 [Bacillus rossius redtenbacheri]|uniref:uncharacterized protein LOC134531430 n=1 Tax=Bacillus rossius redtenbacheri TaxID=93214 RepID=UPI002FDD6E80